MERRVVDARSRTRYEVVSRETPRCGKPAGSVCDRPLLPSTASQNPRRCRGRRRLDDERQAHRRRRARPASGEPAGPARPARLDVRGRASGCSARTSNLAKAEIGDIVGEVKRMVALVGDARSASSCSPRCLLFVGRLLFLGEWLFGSIGWGVLLGTLLLIDIALMALLLAARRRGRARDRTSFADRRGRRHRRRRRAGARPHQPRLDGARAMPSPPRTIPSTRTVLLAAGRSAAVVGILGFLGRHPRRARSGSRRPRSAAALVGALLGWLDRHRHPGPGRGRDRRPRRPDHLARSSPAATSCAPASTARRSRSKFTPDETIELTKETIEWVRARTPLVPKS